jgi:gluconokinase
VLASRSLLVGVDLGTSAVKVIACTPAGKVVASRSGRYALSTPQPERVEQDADEVYRATMRALREVISEVALRGDTVGAVGFSCAMHGIVPVDDRGEALGPLVTWMDRRAAEIADRWHADGTAAALYAATGAPVHPMLPSCKLRWFTDYEPAYAARAAKFVSLKELLLFRWTGEWLIDWGMASGTGLFDFRTHAWHEPALAAAGIDAGKLSTPAAPSTAHRRLRSSVASALGLGTETAVVLASSDGALANLGVGAVAPGDLAVTLGTSGAIRAVVATPALDGRGRTFCYAYDDTKYIVGGPTSSAGAVLNKLQELLMGEIPADERFENAIGLAERAPAGANGLTVVPFLSGERAPYWLAELRGGIAGLDLSHTRGDILRAAFESVVFALGTVLAVLRENLPEPQAVRLSGGLTKAPFIRQLVADIFGCEAILADQDEASAFGAAMMAGIAVGALADDRAVAALLQPLHLHVPNPEVSEHYVRFFARYRAVVEASLPLYGSGSLSAPRC